jgi:methylenetetrahydrofolate reductase (NADPH)
MRIGDIIEHQAESLSFEFFPPKTSEAESRLLHTVKELQQFRPTFVSVTYGAGGGTRETTARVVERIAREASLVVMPHLTCIGESEDDLKAILRQYISVGVRNVLALRGDVPKDVAKRPGSDRDCHAIDLVRLAKSLDAFSIGVAAYPEGHPEAPSLEDDLLHTKEKIDAGADFAITQMFFDNRFYYDYVERAERIGIRVPIIPGIMTIGDVEKTAQFCDTCGTTLPHSLVDRIRSARSRSEQERIGVEFATKQVTDLLHNGVRFFHFYTLNRADLVAEVLRNVLSARVPGAISTEAVPIPV